VKPTLRELFEELIEMGHEARQKKIAELKLSEEESRRLETYLLFDDMKQSPPSHRSARITALNLPDCVEARLRRMLALNVIPFAEQDTIARAMRRLQEEMQQAKKDTLNRICENS
jgi:hypothetical protein